MSYDKNDPRLTAYALDEAEPDDRAAIEKAFQNDPSLREAINEIARASRSIESAINGVSRENDQLSSAQLQKIERYASGERPRARMIRVVKFAGLTAAATLIVAFAAALIVASRHNSIPTILALKANPNKTAGDSLGKIDEFQTAPGGSSASAKPGRPAIKSPATTEAAKWAQREIELQKGLGIEARKILAEGADDMGIKAPPLYVGTEEPTYVEEMTRLSTGANQKGINQPLSQFSTSEGAPLADGIEPKIRDGVSEETIQLQDQIARLRPDQKEQLRSMGYLDSGYVDGDARRESMPTRGFNLATTRVAQEPEVRMRWHQPLSENGRAAESYAPVVENDFLQVSQQPLSTFGLDVDTASYANARRFLNGGQLPPPGAVRIEEFVNAFKYEYVAPADGRPVAVHGEIAGCPWNAEHRLARIDVKANEIPFESQPPLRLTFLIDVSGSMQDNNKLPLLQESMKALTQRLRPSDQIAIVTYRDTAQRVLAPTPCSSANAICSTIDSLHADGSTNGAGGIELAYDAAKEQFLEGGLNRVILATDGDFNVGETENAALVQRIAEHAKSGVFLTVLGFGVDNLKDDRLEGLADKGNGNYYYIDSFAEANKVLVDRMAGTIAVAAKDVKIQVEFNPAKIGAYRLLGYENRALASQDFNDDKKDAGDLGAGHTVTALYELVPIGVAIGAPGVDELKYQRVPSTPPAANDNPEAMTVKLRYKQPNASESDKIEVPLTDKGLQFENAPNDFRFASASAAFAMLLRNSQYAGNATLDMVQQIAEASANGAAERTEFVSLVVSAKTLRGNR